MSWKKVSLTIVIVLLCMASVGMILWIGFQEKIRLAVKNFQKEELMLKEDDKESVKHMDDPQIKDHKVVESKEEAIEVVKHLEGVLRTLEEDNVPTE